MSRIVTGSSRAGDRCGDALGAGRLRPGRPVRYSLAVCSEAMATTRRKSWLVCASLSIGLLAPLVAGCSSSSACPTIGCEPEMRLAYRTAIQMPYSISVAVKGLTLQANCPIAVLGDLFPRMPVVRSCDDRKTIITGVDLGHGQNQTVPVVVTLDGGTATPTILTLTTIINSRDCDSICFVHDGILAN